MSESDRRENAPGLSTEQLQAYLKSKEWIQDGEIRSVATVWHRNEEEFADAEVIVPNPSAKDYRKRIRDALSTLAEFENRETNDIANDIQLLFSDLITVRVIHADTAQGTIPINDGVLLIAKAKELLAAAAHSIYSKRKQFVGQMSKDAKSYLDNLLLGQTEIGSYVVNVIAPNQKNTFDVPNDSEVTLGKTITSNLMSSLDALKKATSTKDEQDEIKAFNEAIQFGASSNMCDALLGFSGEKHGRTFEITVTTTGSPMFGGETRKFQFDSDHVALLKKASMYYKNDYVLTQQTLMGYILKLSRQRDETSGIVTLSAEVAGIQRNIQLELTGDDYHLAVLAHDNRELVKIEGDVHVKGKRSQLLKSSNFGVIKLEDLF